MLAVLRRQYPLKYLTAEAMLTSQLCYVHMPPNHFEAPRYVRLLRHVITCLDNS